MRTNAKKKSEPIFTHEGARAVRIGAEKELRRSVMACMLWEDSFYEDGHAIADRIRELCREVAPEKTAALAVDARERMKLRHMPLLLVRELARRNYVKTAEALERVIQRADELAEFLALYWAEGKCPLSKQVKRGLAKAFAKFSEYDFGKYKGDGREITLRDVMFLVHPKPEGPEREALYKRIADKQLAVPDTWEVALSAGADKRQTFEGLMRDKRLGALAFIRNMRNMREAGVDRDLVAAYSKTVNVERVLPFRFVAAAQHCPDWTDILEPLMFRCLEGRRKLPGKTILVVDTSGSMYGCGNISRHSEMTRVHAAGALAALAREVCERPVIYATAGDDWKRVHATKILPSSYRGFALIDLIAGGKLAEDIGGGGIFLTQCLDFIYEREKTADRIIVLTDEQDCQRSPGSKLAPDQANAFGERNYLINVSVEQNGIAYQPRWMHIDGWSEAVIDYIIESEAPSQ
ncbi:MAG: TROVE domain-containing protein [Armatimonadia bacterium]